MSELPFTQNLRTDGVKHYFAPRDSPNGEGWDRVKAGEVNKNDWELGFGDRPARRPKAKELPNKAQRESDGVGPGLGFPRNPFDCTNILQGLIQGLSMNRQSAEQDHLRTIVQRSLPLEALER